MRRHRFFTFAIALVALLLTACQAFAAIELPALIGDHMMLQRGRRVTLWGTATPGEDIAVAVAGRRATTEADGNGNWRVRLPKLKAGGPYLMTIAGDAETVTVEDVMVGDVWVCSGQSNMQWSVAQSNNAEQEIANADYPGIRLFAVPRKTADTPREDVEASWTRCSPETVPAFSAVGYFFGRAVHKEQDVPVGLIHTSWGGTPAESWTCMPMLESLDNVEPLLAQWEQIIADYPEALAAHNAKLEEWKKQAAQAKKEGKPEPRAPRGPYGPEHPHCPASLYNAMIAPLTDYAIRGAIWYQGESNARRAYQYRTLFPAMIECWRKSWGQGDFPFLFVQLANWLPRKPEPGPSDWAELREAQLMTFENVDATGMAVIIDIGDADDIHPRNKQDVGKRLAMAADKVAYGKWWQFGKEWSSPIYDSMRKRGDKVVLKFDHAYGGLEVRGGELAGFQIAGPDKEFVWADAEIQGRRKVVVWSDQVENPVAVRYGWADNPPATLYNSAGLPASPFRTDNWEGGTAGRYTKQ